MRILLDTHILLWVMNDDDKLSNKAREIILDENNKLYYSVISLWEIELKRLAKAGSISLSAEEINSLCQENGNFSLVDLMPKDIFSLNEIRRKEDVPPHKDPFDRLLLTQSINRKMKLLTHDFMLIGYETDNVIHV